MTGLEIKAIVARTKYSKINFFKVLDTKSSSYFGLKLSTIAQLTDTTFLLEFHEINLLQIVLIFYSFCADSNYTKQ